LWKYLFTVPPSDIIKFDSIEYITVPNNWDSSTDAQITAVRENGNSTVNDNQIKKVYIESQGSGYNSGIGQVLNIQGDGSDGQVVVDVVNGKITNTQISSGGKEYSYGMVDLGSINSNANTAAKLIPIIPPSKGHGYDLYKELGADKVLVYARFDDSTRDFPIDTKFSQIGIIKNPVSYGSDTIFTDNQYSSLYAIKFSTTNNEQISIGDKITQAITTGGNAYGYVASYDSETKVLKYFKDRTAYFNSTYIDQTDYIGISTASKVLDFQTSTITTINPVTTSGGFSGTIDTGFTGITTNPNGNKVISLGVQFNNGLATPEINKGSGDIIYIDNRPLVARNSRQKEDVKIILEF
jgi:hypothetical protein